MRLRFYREDDMAKEEYRCLDCGHSFPWLARDGETPPVCPRCGSQRLERNPWLLGTPSSEGLTEEDYFAAGLKV